MLTTTAGGNVEVWSVTRPEQPSLLGIAGQDRPRAVALGPDGRSMATAGHDGTITRWDLTDPRLPQRLAEANAGGAVLSLAFAPDGRLASGTVTGLLTLWSAMVPRLGAGLEYQRTPSIAGSLMATVEAVDGTAALWDVGDPAQPRRLATVPAGERMIDALALSPDGRLLAVAEATEARLWDVSDPANPRPTGRLGSDLAFGTRLAFAPDGRSVAVVSGGRTLVSAGEDVRLWDITAQDRAQAIGDPLTGDSRGVAGLALSPDGFTLATGTFSGPVELWDLSYPGRPRRLGSPLYGHAYPVDGAAFSADGRTLVTADQSGANAGQRLIVWAAGGLADVRARALELACQYAGGSLDRAAWADLISEPYIDGCALGHR